MAADEEIRRTFDTLAERLRDEISRQLDEFSGPLATSLDRERAAADAARERAERDVAAGAAETDRLAAALADADARLAAAVAVADAEADDRHAEALAKAEARGRDAARAEWRSTELAASERLAEAMRA